MELIRYRKTLDVHKNGIQFTIQGFETADNMSRVIEISLMASGDAIDFPLEGLTAMMYVTTPSAAEPSVNACAIKDNKVMYEVLPIVEAGITEMQLKLIETSLEGAKRVLCSPKFAIEVSASGVTDDGAEQTTTFTALEDAVARANAVYDSRITGVDVDSECIFRVYYADGTVYETDALRRLILNENTDIIDLDSMIKDGIISITADEVAEYLDERYRDIFAKAEMATDLFADYATPTFVQWNSTTLNTPFSAGLTSATLGFAFVFGSKLADHTIIAWSVGADNIFSFTHRFIMAVDDGWDTTISASGGTMRGTLKLGGGSGSVSANDGISYIDAIKDSDNARRIGIANPSDDSVLLENALKFSEKKDGKSVDYSIFGEHNLDLLSKNGFAKIACGTYKGENQKGKKLNDIPFVAKLIFVFNVSDITWKMALINGVNHSISFWETATQKNDVTWVDNVVTWQNDIASNDTAWNVAHNYLDETYCWIAIG